MIGDYLFAYDAREAPLHRLDARAKLIDVALLATGVLASRPVGLIAAAVPIIACLVLQRTSVRRLHRDIRGAYPLLFLIVAASALTGGPVLAGVLSGLTYAARLYVLLLLARIFLASTSLRDIRLAVGRLMRPFPAIWAWGVASMIALAVSFVPTPIRIASELRLASKARGIEPRQHPVRFTRLLAHHLTIRTLMRAHETAMAFECRSGARCGRPSKSLISAASYSSILICGFALAAALKL